MNKNVAYRIKSNSKVCMHNMYIVYCIYRTTDKDDFCLIKRIYGRKKINRKTATENNIYNSYACLQFKQTNIRFECNAKQKLHFI